MNADFETRVMPVLICMAKKMLRDEHGRQDALGNCWWMYLQVPAEQRLTTSAKGFAWYAIRWVQAKRDIPGTGGSGRKADALDRDDTWRSGLMQEILDRSPGPERIVEARELLEWFESGLTPRERSIARGLGAGELARKLALALGVTQGRLSQIRTKLRDRLRG